MTIEPEFSLDQARQINHLAADGVLAKDSELAVAEAQEREKSDQMEGG